MSQAKKPPKKRAWGRAVAITAAKITLVLSVLLVAYLVYLDASLTERFRSQRYEAPALVYGRALLLSPGMPLSAAQLQTELSLLNYQNSRQVTEPGQYRRDGDRWQLYVRAFDFADGPQPAQQVTLVLRQERLQQLLQSDGSALPWLRLEPPYLGRFGANQQENRLLVGLERVPTLFTATLILIEDRDFYQHAGISLTAIARAAVANVQAMRTVQGGSTLTQQLVKNLYLTRDKSLWRKANEALMAVLLDFRFSKDEILETYVNEVYFGQDGGAAIHGIALASQFYFGKNVEALDAADIALLVAMIKGPSYYHPRRAPERARERRDHVLQQMLSHNLIDREVYQQAVQQPLVTSARTRLTQQPAPHYLELVREELAQLDLPSNWTQQGLRIFTYLDPQLQAAAEQALAHSLLQVSDAATLQGAVVIADHRLAGLRAVVGDRQPQQVGFNRARDAIRPIGSLIKPLIYGSALESTGGYDLASLLDDSPLTLKSAQGQSWQPQNYDQRFLGNLLLYQALLQSRNIPTVRLGMELGLPRLIEKLRLAGVSGPLKEVPALTLGAAEMSPLTVTEMYASLAQLGQHRPLQSIAAVTNHAGEPLYQRQLQAANQVLEGEAAYLLNVALQGVVQDGTGKALGAQLAGAAVAGKSGTTNDYRDSWFVAYDASRVITVWLGRDDNQPIGLSGSRGALPLVASIFQQVGVQPLQLAMPAQLQVAGFHPQTGMRIPLDCDNAERFPATPQVLPENLGCDGELKPQRWWQRWF